MNGSKKKPDQAVPPRVRVDRTILHFEDHGQDFLEWTLDAAGVVVDCQPFQAWVWCGCRVSDHAALEAGDRVRFHRLAGGAARRVQYPLTAIERVAHACIDHP